MRLVCFMDEQLLKRRRGISPHTMHKPQELGGVIDPASAGFDDVVGRGVLLDEQAHQNRHGRGDFAQSGFPARNGRRSHAQHPRKLDLGPVQAQPRSMKFTGSHGLNQLNHR